MMKRILIAVSLLVASIAQAETIAYWDFELKDDGTAPIDGQPFNAVGVPNGIWAGTWDQSGNGNTLWGWDAFAGPYFTNETRDGSNFAAGLDAHNDGYTAEIGFTTAPALHAWSPITWTIEAHVKLDAVWGWRTIVGRHGTSFPKPEADFYLQNDAIDDSFRLLFTTVSGQWVEIRAVNVDVVAGQWYGLAAVSDGTTAYLYIDDLDGNGYELEGTAALTGAIPANNAMANAGGGIYSAWTVGRGWFNGALVDHVDGVIDNVRFSDVALSPSEFLPVLGGFVTGGGWIWSPPGAFHPEFEEFESVEGRANFGFVAKYSNGATSPTGQTEFRFDAGDLYFHSSSFQWLVVAGERAMFKGEGDINGEDNYGFMVTGIDGNQPGGHDDDRFRIQIWDLLSDVIVYDNQAGTDDDADLDDWTVLQGGNIAIHKKKK